MSDTVTYTLHMPSLEELTEVLQNGLKKNFADVHVSVVDCPDLTQQPFTFPVKGLCGNPRIADVGGVKNLVPVAKIDIIYDINTIAKKIELPGAYMLGAGAVSYRTIGINAELIHSVKAKTEQQPAVNGSYMARVNPVDGEYMLEKYNEKYSDCDFGLMSNLYACNGESGKVIEVKANKRTGEDNFVSCMKKALEQHYGEQTVGIGGTFVIQQGKAKLHVMGLDLRLEHTHCFSHHGDGGHYHDDTTPNTVQYLGYFHPAELLFRIDRPRTSV
ncbi:ester hydrolase C11orf54 homolog isoform X2 [Ambystoma mexicanum]|uniref:ester hydrolase C11orf54 homolog isoform X2 n=1 Tax=Ambystoma mexicanum TaxID=8296 RepID=UPI0037E7240E